MRSGRPRSLGREVGVVWLSPGRLCGWVLAVAGLLGCGGPGPVERPNILLIVIDTVRADHLGSYGYHRPTSPGIDALARRGALLEQATSAAPYTRASVASILTGVFPSVHQALSNTDSISELTPTLAEMLRDGGYETIGFYRNGNASGRFGFRRGFGSYTVPDREVYEKRRKSGNEVRFISELDDSLLTRAAEAYLQGRPAEPDRPFFLYLHLQGAHDPYTPPAELSFVDEPLEPAVAELYEAPIWHLQEGRTAFQKLRDMAPDEHLREQAIALYDGEIAFADQQVAAILDALAAAAFEGSTLVLVTSDHGEELWDHDGLGHGHSCYQEQLHVPLVIAGPGIGRQRIREPVSLVDLVPTILESAGLEVPGVLPGRSLLPVLQGRKRLSSLPVFAEGFLRMKGLEPVLYRSLQEGRMKLILDLQHSRKMLFDLVEDPSERENAIAREPEAAKRLLDRLISTHHANLASPLLGSRAPVEVPAELESRLRALGYVEEDDAEVGDEESALFHRRLKVLDLEAEGLIGHEIDLERYGSELATGAQALSAEQLLYGWRDPGTGVPLRFCRRAGLRLARPSGHDRWRWEGFILARAGQGGSMWIHLRFGDGEAFRKEVPVGRSFSWEGALPPAAGSAGAGSSSGSLIRIDLGCDPGGDPAAWLPMDAVCGITRRLRVER